MISGVFVTDCITSNYPESETNMVNKMLFSTDFLEKAALDVWSSAKLHAQEIKSGTSLNSQLQVARIKRELQGAAAIIATELLERQEEYKGMRELIGKYKSDVSEAKKQLNATKKSLAITSRELEDLKEQFVEAAPKLFKAAIKAVEKKAEQLAEHDAQQKASGKQKKGNSQAKVNGTPTVEPKPADEKSLKEILVEQGKME